MRSKKGFLLGEETLKIIIALIGMGLLVFLIVKIYYGSEDKEFQEAKSSIERISKEIGSAEDKIEIYNPEGWRFLSWPYEGKIPEACKSKGWKSCTCICQGVGTSGKLIALTPFSETAQEFLEACDDKPACINSEFVVKNIGIQGPIKIEDPPVVLRVNYETKEINEDES